MNVTVPRVKVLLTALCLNVWAANAEELYKPDIPESTQPEKLIEILPETPAEREGSDEVVLKKLRGLVFHNNPDKLFLSGWPKDGGVVLDQMEVPGDRAALETELRAYIGKPVSFLDLNDIRRLVERWFIDHKLPVIQVVAPPGQDITSGVVQYVVVSGRLGEMTVEGAEYNDPEWLLAQMRVESGEQLSSRKLNAQLAWLNRNPFREVNAMLEPGDGFGQTDVTLKVADRVPRRFSARYENTGTKSTGHNRWIVGFNLANLWQRDHMFSYQYTGSFRSRYLKAHSFDYLAPLPWQHIMNFSGAYVRSKPKTGNNFNQEGKSWRLGGQYTIPLSFRGKSQPHEVGFGFNFKRSNSDLNFGGVSVFATDTDVAQFELSYLVGFLDPYGTTQLQVKGVHSPGGLTRFNNNEDYKEARLNALADYSYASISLNRHTYLPGDFSWRFELKAQLSADSLLSNEQLGAGGFTTVRGYNQFLALGDQGLIVRNELRTPGWAVFTRQSDLHDNVQFLVFHDYATLGNNHRLDGERATNLSSLGLGLRYRLDRYLTLRLDYGWQLLESSPGIGKDSQLHAGLEISY